MREKFFSLFSLLIIVSMVLAACGAPPTPAPPAATEAPAQTAAPAETSAPAATEAPAATTAPSAGGGNVIKIATQSPLSGGLSAVGVDIKNGAQLALEQLGKPLTDMGFKLELAPYDDQANPDTGVANSKQITADPAVLCVVGHYNSGVQIPSSEEYHAAGLANVSPANTNPKVTERGYVEVNRIVGRDDMQGAVGAQFANSKGLKTAYVIHDKTTYGQGIAQYFKQEAEKLGMKVLGFEGTEEKANFDAILTPIMASNPDVVYFGGMFDQSNVLFKQARDKGYKGMFLSDDGYDSSDSAKIGGPGLLEGGGTFFTTVSGPASVYEGTAKFITDFKAEFGHDPQPFGAQSYDSMGICLKAIEDAAAAAGGKMPDRASVTKAIRALKDYSGITGTINFNGKGDLTKAKYFVIQVSSADPAKWADNKIVSTIELAPPGTEAAAAPTQPAGAVAPAGSLGTIKIATQSPLSGGLSAVGVDIKNGAQLALEQLGKPLTDMGFKLELAPYDDQANPDTGVANSKQITADPAVLCVVGHYNSGVQIPSSEEYHAAGLANVSPANTNPKVTERGYVEVNRIVGRDDMQGAVGAQFANSKGLKTAYVIHDKTTYGQGIAQYFKQEAEKLGMKVLGFEGTEEKANFDAILTPIMASNPDVVYFGGMFDQSNVLFKQARDKGYKGMFLSDDGYDSSDSAKIGGPGLLEGGGTFFTTVSGPASVYEGTAKFITDFKAEFGHDPQPFGAQSYDSMGICLKAIEDAAAAAGGKMPDRASVTKAIRALKDYSGITGTINFNGKGDLTKAKYFVIQVSSADPAKWADNKIVSTIELAPPQ